MDGTTCESGKICLRGSCILSPLGIRDKCIFADKFVIQSDVPKILKLPEAVMECQTFFEFLSTRNLSGRIFCTDGSKIKANCCVNCQST